MDIAQQHYLQRLYVLCAFNFFICELTFLLSRRSIEVNIGSEKHHEGVQARNAGNRKLPYVLFERERKEEIVVRGGVS